MLINSPKAFCKLQLLLVKFFGRNFSFAKIGLLRVFFLTEFFLSKKMTFEGLFSGGIFSQEKYDFCGSLFSDHSIFPPHLICNGILFYHCLAQFSYAQLGLDGLSLAQKFPQATALESVEHLPKSPLKYLFILSEANYSSNPFEFFSCPFYKYYLPFFPFWFSSISRDLISTAYSRTKPKC